MKDKVITTKHLKAILSNEKLVFKIPGNLADNYYTSKSNKKKPFDLTIVVYPIPDLKNLKYVEHDVFINGVHQRRLYTGNPSVLYNAWCKDIKKWNEWEKCFKRDYRYLLSLNSPEPSQGYDFLHDYLVGKKDLLRRYEFLLTGATYYGQKRKVRHPNKPNYKWLEESGYFLPRQNSKPLVKPAKKRKLQKPYTIIPKINLDISLVCVKDVRNNIVKRIPKYEADKLVNTTVNYEYCDKREWRKYLGELSISRKPEYYWKESEDEDGNKDSRLLIPKVPKEKLEKNKDKQKHKSDRTFDRHSIRQIITIEPPTDENGMIHPVKAIIKNQVPRYVDIPVYGRQPHNKHILFKWKRIFVENVEKEVTIYRFPRTTYKSIVTKAYPNEVSVRRKIVKKNIELLKKEYEKQQKTKET